MSSFEDGTRVKQCRAVKILEAWHFHLALIVVVVMYCYVRTARSYFLADDFGEICYVSKIFAGDWCLFWSNFTGNFMQIPSMSVYRPWLLISLMADFLIWKTTAAGYYITNIIHFMGCSLLIYGAMRQITNLWSYRRSCAAALLAALLFASCPLHCESISWVVGRVDSKATTLNQSDRLVVIYSRIKYIVISFDWPRVAS